MCLHTHRRQNLKRVRTARIEEVNPAIHEAERSIKAADIAGPGQLQLLDDLLGQLGPQIVRS